MNTDEWLRKYGLRPAIEALPAIRRMLEQEAQAGREGRERIEDLALLCAVQLFSAGLCEDVLRIWRAKRACLDLGVVLGVQLLCGPGLEATKQLLATSGERQAAEALAYVRECEAAGDFEGFAPESVIAEHVRYFGLEEE